MTHVLSSFLISAIAFLFFFVAPAMAVGTSDGSSAQSTTVNAYDEAKAMVDEGNFAAALPKLVSLTKTDPQNADAWNLLGFTYRKLGQMEDSSKAYLTVLSINPNHLGALEYQGELFISTGKIEEAKANLAKLKTLCGTCEQAEDLEKALKSAGA
ncbi:tetratricopeptide repeat protein [bacterium]|nr:tetratricopeptide repeat protein [bacterium]